MPDGWTPPGSMRSLNASSTPRGRVRAHARLCRRPPACISCRSFVSVCWRCSTPLRRAHALASADGAGHAQRHSTQGNVQGPCDRRWARRWTGRRQGWPAHQPAHAGRLWIRGRQAALRGPAAELACQCLRRRPADVPPARTAAAIAPCRASARSTKCWPARRWANGCAPTACASRAWTLPGTDPARHASIRLCNSQAPAEPSARRMDQTASTRVPRPARHGQFHQLIGAVALHHPARQLGPAISLAGHFAEHQITRRRPGRLRRAIVLVVQFVRAEPQFAFRAQLLAGHVRQGGQRWPRPRTAPVPIFPSALNSPRRADSCPVPPSGPGARGPAAPGPRRPRIPRSGIRTAAWDSAGRSGGMVAKVSDWKVSDSTTVSRGSCPSDNWLAQRLSRSLAASTCCACASRAWPLLSATAAAGGGRTGTHSGPPPGWRWSR